MFHGVDERVPVDGLKFGVRVLDRFLDAILRAGRIRPTAPSNRPARAEVTGTSECDAYSS